MEGSGSASKGKVGSEPDKSEKQDLDSDPHQNNENPYASSKSELSTSL
jgi:hypothetical protein